LDRLCVAAVSSCSAFGEPDANLLSILDWLDRAADRGANLVCFPEICLQGYCTDHALIHRLGEPIDGARIEAVRERAARHRLIASVGMTLRKDDRCTNSQVFIGPEGVIAAQHKIHLCTSDTAYDPGTTWEIVDVWGWKVGTMICFDSEFPEGARVLAVQGADLIVMPFATGRRDEIGRPAHPDEWVSRVLTYAMARAYDNRLYVVGCNHAGRMADPEGRALANPRREPGVEEWAPAGSIHCWPGYSFVVDPLGRMVAESDRSNHEANMVVTDLDPARIKLARNSLKAKWPQRTVHGDFVMIRRTDTFGDLMASPEDIEANRDPSRYT